MKSNYICLAALLLVIISITAYGSGNTKQIALHTIEAATAKPDTTAIPDSNKIYAVVDQMPVFPGGDREFHIYISRQLKYPDLSKICGDNFECMLFNTRTTVRFVISKTGEIEKVEALKNKGGALSDSLIKVVTSMPRWTPGKLRNKEVDVYFTIPMHLDFR